MSEPFLIGEATAAFRPVLDKAGIVNSGDYFILGFAYLKKGEQYYDDALQYLRQIGGAIEVESEVGKGSVVALWMPLFESGAETERHPMRLAAERT